ncbi:MAG: purine/pyrimidine permease [Chloroflexota bacterium]|nr:purine/pyrimidine permease [Chloroflexota bacterium]MDE2884503.1 purine/pyrimidine permease [Chloroflexota bacterium]
MATVNENVRYEPHENPPPFIALGTGLQAALVILAPVALTVVIVVRIAEESDSYLAWGVFAALVVSGVTTVLQAARLGRIGSGHVLMMGTSGAFIAVCVAALVTAGPATMASLIVVSSLFQFAMAARLSLLRRIFTPVVSGTVIMLIAATVMPIVFGMLTDVPEDASPTAAIVVAAATLVTVLGLVLRAPPRWRLWSPIIGIAVGCAVSAPLGLYNAQGVLDAAWVGVPLGAWPGFDLTPGAEFWALLPAFVIVTLVGAIETIGDGVAIQRVSRRRPQATDFRVVQGALNADGMGNLLSGLAGTLPNTTYSSSVALAEVTGIAARRVGVVIGVIIAVLAFLPKIAALLIAIPSPVAAAYITVLLGLLFVQGMKIVIQDGVDHRKAAVAGVAFWVGTGFQNQWIFADQLGDGFLSVLLGNGMTSGALVAVIMMLFMELTSARRRRLTLALTTESLPQLQEFLRGAAARAGWNDAATGRLVLVGEETMASLLAEDGERPEGAGARRLVVTARTDHAKSELEFVTGSEGENLEDRLAYMGEMPDIADEREISFRLLRHYASSVRHQKYHGEDIVTVSVAGSSGTPT